MFGEMKSFILGILLLNYIWNIGVVWSMLEGKMWFFIIVIFIVVVVIFILMIKNCEKGNCWFMIGLSLILVGVIGNFIDCFWFGYVVDMF